MLPKLLPQVASELGGIEVEHFQHCLKVYGTGLPDGIKMYLYTLLEKEILDLRESLNLYFLFVCFIK